MSDELRNRTLAEADAIEADRSVSHAVEVVMAQLQPGENKGAALEVAQAITRIKTRAEKANLFAFQPAIHTGALFDDQHHYLVVTIMVPWADKDDLERQARQNQLTQGGGGGPRRMS